jgi:hypothetical protein
MSKIRNGLLAVGLIIVVMFAMATITVEARIGPVGSQYDRQAMIEEAYFSVTGVVGSHPFPTSNLLGKWNYMDFDRPAQNLIINRIKSENAGWSTPIIDGWVKYGFKDGVGRGGQCLFFVNLLLYRSEADRRAYSSTNCNYCWSYIEPRSVAIDSTRPKAGDIVFKPRPSQHIVVVVYRDVANPDKIWVVDSNFATNPAPGVYNEVASLRPTTITWLKNNGYRVYTDVSYYNN